VEVKPCNNIAFTILGLQAPVEMIAQHTQSTTLTILIRFLAIHLVPLVLLHATKNKQNVTVALGDLTAGTRKTNDSWR